MPALEVKHSRCPVAFLALTILCAAFLRFWRLNDIPPGLHYDIAASAILSRDIAFNGYRPVFIEAYTGHEVLFYYWAALLARLIGPSVFALRLAAASLGILAVPTAYFAVRQLFYEDQHSRWQAALTAAILSIAFIHVTWSRFGLRAISEPVLQAMALGFLWRGLRRSAMRPLRTGEVGWGPGTIDLALAGLFTGLTAYTYLAARLYSIPLAAGLVALLYFSRRSGRPLSGFISPLLIYLLVAFLTFLPLGYFFLSHPETFLVRARQLTPGAGELGLLLQGLQGAFEMIFLKGEPYDRFNIPGRPIFGPLLGFFFLLGLVVTLKRTFRPAASAEESKEHRIALPLSGNASLAPGEGQGGGLSRASNALLLVWLPVFLLPTALSVHDIFPSNVRAFGELPLIFLFPARGLVAGFTWLSSSVSRITHHASRLTFYVSRFTFSVLLLLSGSLTTYHSYFNVWANLPNQYLNNESDLAHAARWLNARDTSETEIYVSAYHYRHPAMAYLARDYQRIHFIFHGRVLPVPRDAAALYLFPRSALIPEEWQALWSDQLIAAESGPDGAPDFYAYQFQAGQAVPLPEFQPASANFANMVELQGLRVASVVPGERAVVDLLWQVVNVPQAGDFRFVADLVDSWDYHWSQGKSDAYPSEQWKAGDRLVTRLGLVLPPGLPAGDYRLALSLYSPSTATNLPVVNPDESVAAFGIAGPVSIGPTVNVPQSRPSWTTAAVPQNGGLRLLGFDPPPETARPGDPISFALYLTTVAPGVEAGLTLWLRATGGEVFTLESGAPVHGSYPTFRWQSAEFVIDRHSPRLPRDLAPGKYILDLSLPTSTQTLGQINVLPISRVMNSPPAMYTAEAEFGGLIALSGLTLDPDPPVAGQPFTITLNWKSLAATDEDFTAFVHVLNPDGSIAAQRDTRPREGAYPTYLWLPGEYVPDTYTFTLNRGQYEIEVGLYLPDTGKRLGVAKILALTVP